MAFWLRYAVIFAIIFATSAIYNCYLLSNKVILLLDSSHYLITVRHLHAFCIQALNGHLDQGWTALCGPQAAADIMIDGPILPAIGAIAYLISGLEPQATNWPVLAMALSACLATMGSCVGITIENCTQKAKHSVLIACFTGLLSGINPEGLIAASRFLTELPSATILALIAALSSTIFFRQIKPLAASSIYFALPLLAICGFLLKPALGFASFLLPGIILGKALISSERKTAITAAAMMVCGLSAILIPWCAYTKQATGQIHISPERMPLFNLAKGNDLAVDAYSSDPSASTSQQIENLGSVDKILLSTWSRDPIGLSAMYLRKLQRIVVTPWNDFMQTPYGIPNPITKLLHYYLVLSAAAGLLNILKNNQGRRSRAFQIILGAEIISTIMLYLPFEGICRYSYPLNPLLFIFCGLWHYDLFQLKIMQSSKWLFHTLIMCGLLSGTYDVIKYWQISAIPLILTIAVLYAINSWLWIKSSTKISAFLSTIIICGVTLGITTDAEIHQSICKIENGKSLKLMFQAATKSRDNSDNDASILLINARPHSKAFKIFIGQGHQQIELTPIPTELLDDNMGSHANLKRMYCEIYGKNFDDFFQWFACPIPKSINKTTVRTVKISGCDLVCSRDTQHPHISDLRYFSAGKLCNNPDSMDARLISSEPPDSNLQAPIKVGLGPESTAQCFIAKASEAATNQGDYSNYEIPIAITRFDPIFKSRDKADRLVIDKIRIKMAQRIAANIQLKSLHQDQAYLQITLSGLAKTIKKNCELGTLVTLSNDQLKKSAIVPYCPAGIDITATEKRFEFNRLVNLKALGFSPTSIDIAFFPRDWPQFTLYGPDRYCGAFEVRNLTLKISNPDLPRLKAEGPLQFANDMARKLDVSND